MGERVGSLFSDRKVALYGDVRNVKEPSVIMPKLLIAVEWRDGTEHRNTEKFGTSTVSLILAKKAIVISCSSEISKI